MITPFLKTERLSLEPLTVDHSKFMLEMVNTEGWLRFIGNRHVDTEEEAIEYIEKILYNLTISYRIVRLNDNNAPIGIISVIKREYLDHPDIGFAFLPAYSNNGYAYEAANKVLEEMTKDEATKTVLAVTKPSNKNSIKLLTKLGLTVDGGIEVNGERLYVYTNEKPVETESEF